MLFKFSEINHGVSLMLHNVHEVVNHDHQKTVKLFICFVIIGKKTVKHQKKQIHKNLHTVYARFTARS